jgi:hypothetical protein
MMCCTLLLFCNQLVAGFPTCGEADSEQETERPDLYGLFIVKPSGCAMSKTATSMLLKAESTMQARLRAIGSKGLQIVVVAAGSQLSDTTASSAAFSSYLAGLSATWRAVPLPEAEPMRRVLAEQCTIECGLKGSAVATSPQLLLVDSSGSVLVGEGFRHLSLDRNAVAFPWSSVASADASAPQHLLAPLLLPRAVQSSRLCALLLLPFSSKDMSVAEQVCLLRISCAALHLRIAHTVSAYTVLFAALQCLLMDSYRAAAAAVVAGYEVPSGGAMFFYSSHRGYWSEVSNAFECRHVYLKHARTLLMLRISVHQCPATWLQLLRVYYTSATTAHIIPTATSKCRTDRQMLLRCYSYERRQSRSSSRQEQHQANSFEI